MIKRIGKYVIPTDKDEDDEDTSSLEEGYESDEEEMAGNNEIHQHSQHHKQPQIEIKEKVEDFKEKLLSKKTEREGKIKQG